MDYGLVHRMKAADNVYRVVNRLRNAHGEQIHGLTDSERILLRALMDNGIELLD